MIEPLRALDHGRTKTGPNSPRLRWFGAEEALREASAIVLMGFRFPPADSHARARLLTAISMNERGALRVHIVIGPKTQDSDVLRTDQLLKLAIQRRRGMHPTYVEPLLAEDFLTVMEREQFAGPK